MKKQLILTLCMLTSSAYAETNAVNNRKFLAERFLRKIVMLVNNDTEQPDPDALQWYRECNELADLIKQNTVQYDTDINRYFKECAEPFNDVFYTQYSKLNPIEQEIATYANNVINKKRRELVSLGKSRKKYKCAQDIIDGKIK